MRQVTLRSCEMGFHKQLYTSLPLPFYLLLHRYRIPRLFSIIIQDIHTRFAALTQRNMIRVVRNPHDQVRLQRNSALFRRNIPTHTPVSHRRPVLTVCYARPALIRDADTDHSPTHALCRRSPGRPATGVDTRVPTDGET